MKDTEKIEQEHVRIRPGEYYVSNQSIVISTLLGSCISACLYDPVRRIIGMNHFLLSNKRYSKNMPYYITEAGRYGIHAMELLINEMLRRGAKREYLKAKAFGGASLLSPSEETGNFCCVGDVNSRFIRDFLDNEGIPIVASDLGGDHGRVIYFQNDDFSVYVRKIRKTVNTRLGLKEKQFWQRSIETQEKKPAEIDIWE